MSVRYYISSSSISAEKLASSIRGYWSVENQLHWRLDVVMNEDHCRIRRGAELFFGIRHIAVNVLSQNKEFKAGLRSFVIFPWIIVILIKDTLIII